MLIFDEPCRHLFLLHVLFINYTYTHRVTVYRYNEAVKELKEMMDVLREAINNREQVRSVAQLLLLAYGIVHKKLCDMFANVQENLAINSVKQ